MNFRFSSAKFVTASAYLAQRCPEVTKMKLAKLVYFADKQHFLLYGRPITGDRYIKMEHGPVPSEGYNLIKHDERSSREDQELFDDFLRIEGNDVLVRATPDLSILSETDIEALDLVIVKYGSLTAAQLRQLSHREEAWIKASDNAEMDYRWFFHGHAESRDVWEIAQEDQELRDALENIEFGDIIVPAS